MSTRGVELRITKRLCGCGCGRGLRGSNKRHSGPVSVCVGLSAVDHSVIPWGTLWWTSPRPPGAPDGDPLGPSDGKSWTLHLQTA